MALGRTFTPPAGQTTWPAVQDWSKDEWAHWCAQAGVTGTAFGTYWQARDTCGLRVQRQEKRQAPVEVWLYRPTPRQVAFHQHVATNVLYGGAYGGAKSEALRWDAHRRAFWQPHHRAILFRRTLMELKDNHIDKARREADLFGGTFIEGDKTLRYPNGSWLRFAHCENTGDEEKYLSSEYEWIGLDELATFTQTQALAIISRARTSTAGVTAVVRCSSNPAGAHTQWCVDRFIDHVVTPDEDPAYDAADWQFVGAKLYDNPYLMDPDGSFTRAEKRLSPFSPERRRQMLEGDWTAIGGQFFPEFRRDRHVADRDGETTGVWWERWLDWGYNAPGVCYWAACLPDGRLYVRHEYKFTQTIAADVAQHVIRQTKDLEQTLGHRVTVRKSVADPSMWNHTGHTGESIADTFARYGVVLQKGDNERELGWQRVRHFLATAPDGEPWIQWHPSCVYAIRSIPSLVSDAQHPDDADTDGDDHAADACFVAGTTVQTPYGPCPIELIEPGDHVMTRLGPCPVLAAGKTGTAAMAWTMTLDDGRSVTATGSHPFWTADRGFVAMNTLRYGDILSVWDKAISTETPARSGAGITDRFLPGITSIIAMGIRRITTSRIWSVFPDQFISHFTANSRRRMFHIWRGFVPWLRRGIDRTPDGLGIANTVGGCGSTDPGPRWIGSASSATRRSPRHNPARDFVPMPVNPRGDDAMPIATNGSVASAVLDLPPIATTTRSAVAGPVARVRAFSPAGTATVYNLSVADVPEYYANGILVHNCRYGMMGRPAPSVSSQRPSSQPGSIAWLRDRFRPKPGFLIRDVHAG